MKKYVIQTVFCFKLIVLFASLVLPNFIFSQNWENLVPNYSFEKHNFNNWNAGLSCTNDPLQGTTNSNYYNYMEEYWSVVENWTLPLKRKFCINFHQPPVPTADLYNVSCYGSNKSRSGDTWGHTKDDGEYLIVSTKNWLESNKTYYIEVFHSGTGTNDRVVAYKNQPVACKYNKDLIDYHANIEHNILLNIYSTNTSGWTRFRGYFSPSGDKKWLSFGGSGEWDDLRIYEVQPNKCRDNWYFDNTVFNYPMEVFQASNNIYIGNGVDPENGTNHIAGDVIQYASSSVVLKAGNQIIIDHGTFIEGDQTKVFEISPEPCGDNLCPDELEFENQILCSEATKQIGTEANEWGTTVHWSPSTYLDNTNISNPTFTSPGGNGAIKYTVKVTYHCDDSEGTHTDTHHVLVQYTDVTDPSANVSANNTQWDDYNFGTDLNFSDGVTEFKIEVNSSPGYSKTFYKGKDYSCCSFHWDLPDAWRWSSCADDKVKITAINKCSGQQNIISLDWDKTTTPFSMPSSFPNVITPNGDNVNDYLCFNTESADYYYIITWNRWGNIITKETGNVKSAHFCSFSNLGFLSDGVYFYFIRLYDECGNQGMGSNFLHIIHGNSNLPPQDPSRSERNPEFSMDPLLFSSRGDSSKIAANNVVLVPNPATQIVTINGIDKISYVEIMDGKGKLVIRQSVSNNNQFNVENLASGIYFVRILNPEKPIVKKLVVL